MQRSRSDEMARATVAKRIRTLVSHVLASTRVAEEHETMAIRTTTSSWVLVLALAVGMFLRLSQINAVGFTTDEAVYAGQAAAIAGDPALKPFFPMFRAHPLLFQFIASFGFHGGVND